MAWQIWQERWRLYAIALLFLIFAPWTETWVRTCYFLTRDPHLWQFVTAHFTHWSWLHLLNNSAATLCLIALYGHLWSTKELLSCIGGIWITLSIYLSLIYTRSFYLGASALLYSLFFYAALRFWRHQPVMSTLVIVYIAWSALISGGADIGVPVASEVHIVGILGAALMHVIRVALIYFGNRG